MAAARSHRHALRSVAWFDGAGAGPARLTLGLWLAVGLVLSAVPGRDRPRALRSDADSGAPVPAVR